MSYFGAGARRRIALMATVILSAASLAAPGTFEGRVLDETTDEPVPFVNVGIPGGALGTVSDELGRFTLEGRSTEHAVIRFSAIGYRTLDLSLDAFPGDGTIQLTPEPRGYHVSVTVSAGAGVPPQIFGKRYEERGYGLGFASAYLGAEIGARIPIDGPTYLESANFIVAHTGGERFLYRVKIYDFADGILGANLLARNVVIAAEQQRGTLTVDLREQRLVVRDDVLLSLEWIQDDADAGNANVMFRARPRGKRNVYLKLTSHMEFRAIERHTLGFYLLGYSLSAEPSGSNSTPRPSAIRLTKAK